MQKGWYLGPGRMSGKWTLWPMPDLFNYLLPPLLKSDFISHWQLTSTVWELQPLWQPWVGIHQIRLIEALSG